MMTDLVFLKMNVSNYHIEAKFYANQVVRNPTVLEEFKERFYVSEANRNKAILEEFKERDYFLIIKSS